MPEALRRFGSARHPVIVSTNYDDLIEQAFRAAGQEYDLITYAADGETSGKFVHYLPNGRTKIIERPNKYDGLALEQRPAILKLHGAVDRRSGENDSFVVTEDHYIDYLTGKDLSSLVPVQLAARLKKSHFLFLGYGLGDWSLRVILRRIWGEQKLYYKSWAVQRSPDLMEQKFWEERGVQVLDLNLREYVTQLAKVLGEKQASGFESQES